MFFIILPACLILRYIPVLQISEREEDDLPAAAVCRWAEQQSEGFNGAASLILFIPVFFLQLL